MSCSRLAPLLVSLAIVGGCSSSEVPPAPTSAGAPSGGAGAVSVPDGAGARAPGVATAGIFTAESTAIEIDSFNFFRGGYGFARRRDQLSPRQLALVEAIEVISSTGACWTDSDEVGVTVSAGESKRSFRANEHNGDCGSDVTLVDFGAVRAVLDTVHCLSAKGYDGTSPATAPTISTNDGCHHGLFSSGAPDDWWFRVEVPTPDEYRVSFDNCRDRALLVELFSADAQARLASIDAADGCPTLSHPFVQAGVYLLHVRMQAGLQGGDFYLSVDSTAK